MNNQKRFPTGREKIYGMIAVLVICLMFGLSGCAAGGDFSSWNQESEALNTLQNYVEAVTNKGSDAYVPEADRIAVFDLDGTLYGEKAPIYIEWWLYAYRVLEDEDYTPTAKQKEVADKIVAAAESGSIPEELEKEHAVYNAQVFAGMTQEAYAEYARAFLQQDVPGYTGMTYAEAFFKPMTEVVNYLKANDFKVYIVSGTDRDLCRVLACDVLGIPKEQVIGMDVALVASGQNGKDGLDYVYTDEDEVVRGESLVLKNVKMNKVSMIAREIGRQPILAFGNSSGDMSMATYVLNDNPYPSAVFMLIADDEERENGNAQKAEQARTTWEEHGFNVISMKNDFKTIYGDAVTRVTE